MSEGLNRVTLLGNLGADPELRFTGAGVAVLGFRLATTESYVDAQKQRQERTEWHNVVVWNKRAEALAKILAKGSQIAVEGSLRTSSYEKDGVKRYKTEIHATNVLLCGGARGGGEQRSEAPQGRGGGHQGARQQQRPAAPEAPADDYAGDYGSGGGGDIPF